MTHGPRRRGRAFGWPISPRREVDEEIAAHLELQVDRYVRAGLDPDVARAEAYRRFGDVDRVRDECRTIREHMEVEMRSSEWFSELRQDLLLATRGFARQPLFTAAVLLTLAIGIGANTAVFSVVHAVLLRALPYANADRVVTIWNAYDGPGLGHAAVAPPEVADITEQSRALDAVSAFTPARADITSDGEPERVVAYRVSPDLFTLLGAVPALGRGFTADDGAANAPAVVVLSDALWRRRFGGDPAIVGRSITISGVPRTVIGVMPRDVRFPDAPLGHARERGDLWLPVDWVLRRTEERGNQYLAVIARIRPTATLGEAERDVARIAQGFRTAFPDRYAGPGANGWRMLVVPLRDDMVGATRPALLAITGAVAFVLLIACVNVANLLLARGASRAREVAVRVALGARRARLVRQLLTESTAIGLGGGLLGAAVAWGGLRLVVRLAPSTIPRLDGAQLDGSALAFALGASLVTGIVVGVLPALRQTRADLRPALGDGARGATGGRAQGRLRTGLVAAEVAMAVVVLVGAALLGRSFVALQRVSTGFRADAQTMTAQIALPRRTYDSAAKIVAFTERLDARLAGAPGVTTVAGVYPLPMSGEGWSGSFMLPTTPASGAEIPHAEYAVALPGYFRALGIPLVVGRDFTMDDKRGAPAVAIVDEQLARRYWPGASAIGQRINVLGMPDGEYASVIGVVGHVRSARPRDDGEPQIYLPMRQRPQSLFYVVARGSTPVVMRTAVRDVDPLLPLAQLTSMHDVVAGAVTGDRFNTTVLGVFGAAALLLAAVGLYGVMAYLVAQRTREVGIRIALGGRPRDVQRLVVRQGLAIAALGLCGGIAIALVLGRSLSTLLFGVRAADPVTYATIAGVLMLVAFIASWIPARRATQVDPVNALRG